MNFFDESLTRREFLKRAGALGLTAATMNLPALFYRSEAAVSNNRLIVVFLRGAVDGLSIVAPYKDATYYSSRPQISIAKDNVLDLDGKFGLHPALKSVMPYWQQKSLAFVQAAGSPNPSRSHFDAQDYMEGGKPGDKLSSGWINRALDIVPLAKTPTAAVSFGSTMPLAMKGPNTVANINVQGKKVKSLPIDRPLIHQAFDLMYQGNDAMSKSYREGLAARQSLLKSLNEEMTYADNGALSALGFGGYAARIGQAMAKDPTLKVAFTDLGGWDTHVNQGSAEGQLANKLGALGNGLSQIIKALGPVYADTTLVVMSEFGRTVDENGNRGTDHGHGNVMWVLGGKVNGGKVYGDWRGLSTSALFEGRDLPVTTDFRSVLSMVLTKRMGVPAEKLAAIFPGYTPGYGSLTGLM